MRHLLFFLIVSISGSVYSQEDFSEENRILIDSIAGLETIESERVGRGGTVSQIWRRFSELLDEVGTEKIYTLADHESPNIRAYTIWFLTREESKLAINAYRKLRNDDSEINVIQGCILSTEKLSFFSETTLLGYTKAKYGNDSEEVRALKELMR